MRRRDDPPVPVSPLQAFGLMECVSESLQEAQFEMDTKFGGLYLGPLRGVYAARVLKSKLIAKGVMYGWGTRVRDYYGHDVDPGSLVPSFPLVDVGGGVGVVIFNATYGAVPRSKLNRRGLTRLAGSQQVPVFGMMEMEALLGWAIPPDLSRIVFMRYRVDRSVRERNVAYGFDLVELEGGGDGVREFIVRNLAAYGSEFARPIAEPTPEPRVVADADAMLGTNKADISDLGDEPEVTWSGDDLADELN